MYQTYYIWDSMNVALKELASMLNDGWKIISSQILENKNDEDGSVTLDFAAVLIKEEK